MDLSSKTGSLLHVAHAWRTEVRSAYEVTPPVTLTEWCEKQAQGLLAKELQRIEEAGGEFAEEHLVRGRPIDAILGLCSMLDPVLPSLGNSWAVLPR